MNTPLALLHTAQSHTDLFDREAKANGLAQKLTHHVEMTWLDQARSAGLDAVSAHVGALIDDLHQRDIPLLCTCTTLGPLMDRAAAQGYDVVRIDQALMEALKQRLHGLEQAGMPSIAMLFSLDTAAASTMALMTTTLSDAQRSVIKPVIVPALWDAFLGQDKVAMNAAALSAVDAAGCDIVVAGQASLHDCAHYASQKLNRELISPVTAGLTALMKA